MQFQYSVLAHFPEKKSQIVTVIENKNEQTDYVLVYFRKDSEITVTIEDADDWVKYEFELYLIPVKRLVIYK